MPASRLSLRFALFLIISMHLAGFIGLQVVYWRALFEGLVPFNLVMSAGLLLAFHTDWQRKFIFFAVITFLIGYFVEVIGVHSKVIFGAYQYDTTLGLKVFETPLLIGINWLILVYCVGVMTDSLEQNILVKSFLGAILMVWMDYWIEPVAIRHHFWHWEGNHIPLQNYIGWLVVSFFLVLFFHSLRFQKNNPIALPLYLAQFFFFLGHNIFYLFYET